MAVFVMSLPYSDAVYIQVFPRECTETFQEGHARAFTFLGGVPTRIAYDNTKTAVAKIVGPRETYTLAQLTDAVEYALDIGIEDPDSIRLILEHRADRPTELFRLDGRPHLAGVRVEPTDVAAYASLLTAPAPLVVPEEVGVAS